MELWGAEPGDNRVWWGKGSQQGMMPQNPFSKAAMSSEEPNFWCSKIICNSKNSPGPTWRLAIGKALGTGARVSITDVDGKAKQTVAESHMPSKMQGLRKILSGVSLVAPLIPTKFNSGCELSYARTLQHAHKSLHPEFNFVRIKGATGLKVCSITSEQHGCPPESRKGLD